MGFTQLTPGFYPEVSETDDKYYLTLPQES